MHKQSILTPELWLLEFWGRGNEDDAHPAIGHVDGAHHRPCTPIFHLSHATTDETRLDQCISTATEPMPERR
jgi:hypothetical protein